MGIVSSRPQINSKLKFVTSFLHNPKLKENKTILAIWLGYSSNYSHSQVDYRKVQQLQDI